MLVTMADRGLETDTMDMGIYQCSCSSRRQIVGQVRMQEFRQREVFSLNPDQPACDLRDVYVQ